MDVDINNLPKELLEELNFRFNKDKIPKELKPLLIEIESNKRKWKSLYMAVWGLPLYYLNPVYIEKGMGDDLLILSLPASKYKFVYYRPSELKGYLTDYDKDIHIGQVIKIFTLLENYFISFYELTEKSINQEGHPLLNLIEKILGKKNNRIDLTRFSVLKKYLRNKGFASARDLLELELAKETRNCFVHRRELIDKRWLSVYKKTGRKNGYKIGDKVPTPFSDLEDWTDLMIGIVDKSLDYFRNDPTRK